MTLESLIRHFSGAVNVYVLSQISIEQIQFGPVCIILLQFQCTIIAGGGVGLAVYTCTCVYL